MNNNNTISGHTRLINYMIGFCKNEPCWITPLLELKYKPTVMEQSISTRDGSRVVPDIIFSSDRQQHILVCECKGGTTLDTEQINRYKDLTTSDLLRWVRLHTEEITHDVCYAMFESTRRGQFLLDAFPILTFSDYVKKYGKKFTKRLLEKKFEEEISIAKLKPPLSYYPFSADDDRSVIIPHVLRAVMSLAHKNRLRSARENDLDYDEILRSAHEMAELFSKRYQRQLKDKIKGIIKELSGTYSEFKAFLENRDLSTSSLANFTAVCEHILEEERSVTRMTDFHGQNASDRDSHTT